MFFQSQFNKKNYLMFVAESLPVNIKCQQTQPMVAACLQNSFDKLGYILLSLSSDPYQTVNVTKLILAIIKYVSYRTDL